jgi:hypothetical protein
VNISGLPRGAGHGGLARCHGKIGEQVSHRVAGAEGVSERREGKRPEGLLNMLRGSARAAVCASGVSGDLAEDDLIVADDRELDVLMGEPSYTLVDSA